ncbi:S41 family peptidase [Streptomyces roseus]|uniref:S41 family peptidase n=1 Tax=Streptomyces roseus TaxID=66430 RepID=UPI0033EBA512
MTPSRVRSRRARRRRPTPSSWTPSRNRRPPQPLPDAGGARHHPAGKLPGQVGYLSLPGIGGAPAGLDTYVRQARAAVKEAERGGIACGWIVDLRQNEGGNIWPMFAVAAPLLGEGKVGSFVFPDGSRTPWYVKNRRPGLNGKESRWGPPIRWGGRTRWLLGHSAGCGL